MLLGLCSSAQADLGDDQYLQIYSLIQQADDLNASGKAALAKAKYQEALTAVEELQRGLPDLERQVGVLPVE